MKKECYILPRVGVALYQRSVQDCIAVQSCQSKKSQKSQFRHLPYRNCQLLIVN
jgi:hypothetical protein